ncbi:MAG: hypothetical protein L6Q76_35015 [Polyangiaceae bacterium]|nr:hypothetical protein [Polyangiaceae bacterium]
MLNPDEIGQIRAGTWKIDCSEITLTGDVLIRTRGFIELLVFGGAEPGAVPDFGLSLVRQRKVRERIEPFVTNGGFEHVP